MEELENTPIPNKKHKMLKQLSIVFAVIIVAVIIGVVVSQTCFTTYIVEGDSMKPTLDGGEHGVPLDGERLILNTVAKVKRGDIIVFQPQDWVEISNNRSLVKRVIATSGDTISIKNNQVILNGDVLDEPYIMEGSLMDDMPEKTIPNGEYFCMGDNRNNSLDCRASGKNVKDSEIIGRCWLIKNHEGKLKKAN